MKGSRGLIKPKSTKVRPDLVGTGSSSMLTVLSPHQQALHQQQVLGVGQSTKDLSFLK